MGEYFSTKQKRLADSLTPLQRKPDKNPSRLHIPYSSSKESIRPQILEYEPCRTEWKWSCRVVQHWRSVVYMHHSRFSILD